MSFIASLALGGAAGLAAAPHCLGMCGPLAAYACAQRQGQSSAWLYQLGRLASYVVLGALAGHAGSWITNRFSLPWVSALLSWSVAFVLLLAAFKFLWKPRDRTLVQTQSLQKKKPRFSLLEFVLRFIPRQPWAVGLMTGFLPCGALAAALLLAAGAENALGGALRMVGFAAASAPALLGVGLLSGVLRRFSQGAGRYVFATAFLLGAVLFIWRPFKAMSSKAEHDCCHDNSHEAMKAKDQ
ncbi:MAG: sulfite exporter TauE/SafE family protein [Myxococcales bacterium]|nr:MAG: sulfite exporter TauE/SafE family protein [Myxococcales bacterium]